MTTGDKAQVMIELQLEMKKLKGQLKDVVKEFKSFKKELEAVAKTQADSMDDQLDALKKVETAQAKAAKNWAKGEKEKAKASKASTDEIGKQEKELGRLGKIMEKIKKGGIGKFAGGLAAGAGLSRSGQGTAQSMGGSLGRGISRGAGGILGFATSGITQAYQTYMQYGAAQAGLAGLGTPGQMRGGLKAAGGVGGANLGYGPTETVQQARGIGRATGNIGAVYQAQQLARGYGMDVGEAGGYMGMMRQAGFGFGGTNRQGGAGTGGTRELTKVIEAGMISGLEKGRIGEFLQGVSQITGQLGSQLPGKINVSGIAAQAATLGQSKLPGFQGARGMQLLARLNQSIQKPGGGEAGQSMMMQALGFGKPGGGTRYYEALKMQEQGINDPRNMPKMFKEVYSQLGDPSKGGRAMVNEEANLAMKEMTGLSLKTVEELQDIVASGANTEEAQERIKELMEQAAPIEEQAMKVSREGFLGVSKHLAGVEAKQIGIGAKFAGYFMKMQNYQLEALKILTDQLPKVIKWLREVYAVISSSFQETLFQLYGKDVMKVKAAEYKQQAKDAKIIEEAGTLEERQKAWEAASKGRQGSIEKMKHARAVMRYEVSRAKSNPFMLTQEGAEAIGRQPLAEVTYQQGIDKQKAALNREIQQQVAFQNKVLTGQAQGLSEQEAYDRAAGKSARLGGTRRISGLDAAAEAEAARVKAEFEGLGKKKRGKPPTKDPPSGRKGKKMKKLVQPLWETEP